MFWKTGSLGTPTPAPEAVGAATPAAAPESELDRQLERFRHGIAYILRRHGWRTLKYMTGTEVHTYAFSVAANAILSFFPFVVLMLTLSRRVFHSQPMFDVVLGLLRDYLPSNQDFVVKNMRALATSHGTEVFSIFMLLFTSTGIFLPLEVALNSVWGIKRNRSYLGNQVMSLALAVGCGSLAMGSVALTAFNWRMISVVLGSENFVFKALAVFVMKLIAFLVTILVFFLIFWLLPNGKVPFRAVFPAAFITGVMTELSKYIYILLLPWLDFQKVYGPFAISVTLMIWAYVSGMLMLGGAYLSAAEHNANNVTLPPGRY